MGDHENRIVRRQEAWQVGRVDRLTTEATERTEKSTLDIGFFFCFHQQNMFFLGGLGGLGGSNPQRTAFNQPTSQGV